MACREVMFLRGSSLRNRAGLKKTRQTTQEREEDPHTHHLTKELAFQREISSVFYPLFLSPGKLSSSDTFEMRHPWCVLKGTLNSLRVFKLGERERMR
jgi:hypothetical protein